MSITALPTPPNRSMAQAVFTTTADAFLAAMPTFATEANALATQVNADAATATTQAGIATAQAVVAAAQAASATAAANVNGTSATSTTPVVGTAAALTYVEANRVPAVGMRLRFVSRANPTTNFGDGTVTAWNGLSGAGLGVVTITPDNIGATPAAASDWNIVLEGQPGASAALNTPTVTIGASGSLIKTNAGAHVFVTATSAIALDTPAILSNGWSVFFPKAAFAITLTGAAFTDGAGTTRVIAIGAAAVLQCNGSSFTLTTFQPQSDHEVTVYTGNGFGSTNTLIRRFTTTKRNVGTAITYADSATLGASFTIVEAGLYAISYTDSSINAQHGISVNTTAPTTIIGSIAESEILFATISTTLPHVGGVFRLAAGDVVRVHTGSATSPGTTGVRFSIRKVGV